MPRPNLKTKTCETCDSQFHPNSGAAKYCSNRCHLHANVYREPNGCLEHMGVGDKNGYIEIVVSGRRKVRAHRLSYEIEKGQIPQGMLVCHSCDNPPCIDVKHLFIGTAMDNRIDCASKGRVSRGEEINRGVLTKEKVLAIVADPRSIQVTAKHYVVGSTTVGDIRRGRIWGWLTGVTQKTKSPIPSGEGS